MAEPADFRDVYSQWLDDDFLDSVEESKPAPAPASKPAPSGGSAPKSASERAMDFDMGIEEDSHDLDANGNSTNPALMMEDDPEPEELYIPEELQDDETLDDAEREMRRIQRETLEQEHEEQVRNWQIRQEEQAALREEEERRKMLLEEEEAKNNAAGNADGGKPKPPTPRPPAGGARPAPARRPASDGERPSRPRPRPESEKSTPAPATQEESATSKLIKELNGGKGVSDKNEPQSKEGKKAKSLFDQLEQKRKEAREARNKPQEVFADKPKAQRGEKELKNLPSNIPEDLFWKIVDTMDDGMRNSLVAVATGESRMGGLTLEDVLYIQASDKGIPMEPPVQRENEMLVAIQEQYAKEHKGAKLASQPSRPSPTASAPQTVQADDLADLPADSPQADVPDPFAPLANDVQAADEEDKPVVKTRAQSGNKKRVVTLKDESETSASDDLDELVEEVAKPVNKTASRMSMGSLAVAGARKLAGDDDEDPFADTEFDLFGDNPEDYDYQDPAFMMNLLAIIRHASDIAVRNAKIVRDFDEISLKGQGNFLTKTDCLIEEYLKEQLSQLLPGSGIISEESEADFQEANWIVDPLDGTTNFMNGLPYAISVALVANGKTEIGVVYSVTDDTMYYAQRGAGAFIDDGPHQTKVEINVFREDEGLLFFGCPYNRKKGPAIFSRASKLYPYFSDVKRIGPAAIDICEVARGSAKLYIEFDLKPWDVAAGMLILKEAGGYYDVTTDNMFMFGSEESIMQAVNVLGVTLRSHDN